MTSDDLVSTVAGDLTAFARLQTVPHEVGRRAQTEIPPLLLTLPALHRILSTLQHDRDTTELIQRWASFVRHGYGTGSFLYPLTPLDINYDPQHEDVIVEIISRLTELGDLIDGTIDDAELATMLRATLKNG